MLQYSMGLTIRYYVSNLYFVFTTTVVFIRPISTVLLSITLWVLLADALAVPALEISFQTYSGYKEKKKTPIISDSRARKFVPPPDDIM